MTCVSWAFQAYIADLKATKVVETPELRHMGIKPELDPATNTIKITRVPKPDGNSAGAEGAGLAVSSPPAAEGDDAPRVQELA